MLRVLGSSRRVCAGPTRRDFLVATALAAGGLALPAPAGAPAHFGQAKSCILLFLYGSPSQLETFDPKPDAPIEVRGELKSIRSRLPGCDVNELLPYTARVMDKVTVLRSLTHPHPIHGVAYATTGTPTIDVPMELNPHDGRHWPFIGSVVEYLTVGVNSTVRQRVDEPSGLPPQSAIPTNLALPFPFSSRRAGEVARAGPYPAFLGTAHAPLWTEFRGTATRTTIKTLTSQKWEAGEPYMGVSADSRFELASAPPPNAELTLDRLNRRRTLVQQFDAARRDLDSGNADRTRQTDLAYGLMHSDALRRALDIGREPHGTRESYGLTLFGQGCLAARRLVEAGSRFVSVFWDEYGLAGSGWDTHWDHYPRLKNELMPGFDRALAGLISDLDQRGLLDTTLVLVLSEHGRTPKLQNVPGGGRDHWARAYSAVLAGGGIARGRVVGRTDKIASDVADHPVSPKDVLATAYHLLGIDPHTTIPDRTGRPQPLVPGGEVIAEVLA